MTFCETPIAGFLHGFLAREPDTEVQYKVDNPYVPDCDGVVRWDDPDLAIDWPTIEWPFDADSVLSCLALSGKDAAAPRFAQWESPFGLGEAA